jgi:diacylglycerol kinase (ATP)
MLRIGLISNPNSERNRRGLADLRAVSAETPDLLHFEIDGQRSLLEILTEMARREVRLLVVNGGDGTVQRVLTDLLEARPFERPPALAILARGMANMTAGDVGLRGRAVTLLHRLIGAVRTGEVERSLEFRRILRVESIRERSPQRCMFFGAAAIYDAIEFCCSKVYPLGLRGNLGMSLTLGGLLLRGLFGGGNGTMRGHDIAVTLDGDPVIRTQRLLVLATTLERLILRSRPFWAEGSGSIRFTSIAHPPVHLIRSAPKVLYGWRRATLPREAYISRSAERIALHLDSPFTLDGELFEPDPEQPLVLTAPDSLAFVRLGAGA